MAGTVNRDYLGSGWKFPLQVNSSGGIALARYEQRVEESIYLILETAKGERLMRSDFGCGIHDLVFQANNDVTLTLVRVEVREALVRFEPRIEVLDVSVDAPADDPNLLLIRVDYRIRSNQVTSNLVYPFYIKEGI